MRNNILWAAWSKTRDLTKLRRRRRRQRDRQKSNRFNDKKKFLHVHHAFLYIFLLFRCSFAVELIASSFVDLISKQARTTAAVRAFLFEDVFMDVAVV